MEFGIETLIQNHESCIEYKQFLSKNIREKASLDSSSKLTFLVDVIMLEILKRREMGMIAATPLSDVISYRRSSKLVLSKSCKFQSPETGSIFSMDIDSTSNQLLVKRDYFH